MCVIVLSYRWIILENNNIDSLYFFQLIEFYKENILTSWNICLAKEVRFFSPFYFCLSILRTELNEIWQHVEGNNTLSYIRSLTNLVFPRILRKTFGGTSSIPILHHVLSKTRKSREIETFSWTNKRIFKYVYLRFFLMKLSKLIETRFWSDYPRKLTRRSEKHHTNFREKAEGYKILWVSTWANRTIT